MFAPLVGESGGTPALEATGGMADVGGTGGIGGPETTGGVSFSAGGTMGTGAAVASETGGERGPGSAGSTAELDAPADSSDPTSGGCSCSNAGSTRLPTGGLGLAMVVGLALIRRRERLAVTASSTA